MAVITTTYASFKVAENVPDQGANRNTFFADASLDIGPTNSNSNATYKLAGDEEGFSLSTGGQTLVKKDSMTTTVTGTTGGVGAISISEEDCAPGTCTGQIATVHVQDGAPQDPYLVWTIVVVGSFDGVIEHELDDLARTASADLGVVHHAAPNELHRVGGQEWQRDHNHLPHPDERTNPRLT